MNEEEAIKHVPKWKYCAGTSADDLDAINILCDCTKEALARRTQPDMGKVLDEVYDFVVKTSIPISSAWTTRTDQVEQKIKELKAKYCTPEPVEEKVTVKSILFEMVNWMRTVNCTEKDKALSNLLITIKELPE